MAAASKDALNNLHALVALTLASQIKDGTKKMSKDGDAVVEDASPALLAVAIKFLKDNNIEALVTPNSPLASLTDALPFPVAGESVDFQRLMRS